MLEAILCQTNKRLIVRWLIVIETDKQNLNCELVNCDLRQTFGCELIDWDVKKNKQPLIVNWLFVIWQKKTTLIMIWKETNRQTNFWLCGWNPVPERRGRSFSGQIALLTNGLHLPSLHPSASPARQLIGSLAISISSLHSITSSTVLISYISQNALQQRQDKGSELAARGESEAAQRHVWIWVEEMWRQCAEVRSNKVQILSYCT